MAILVDDRRTAGERTSECTGDAFGELLLQCLAAGLPERRFYEICEREDGYIGVSDAVDFFAAPDRWPAIDQWAYQRVAGRVLDVGVGAGRFALALQESSTDVVGLDVSPGAVDVCRRRGLTSVVLGSVGDLPAGERFDTFLLMGKNLGLLEGRDNGPRFLTELAAVANPGARIVGTGMDPYAIGDPDHTGYFASNRSRGRMSGQMRLRLRHQRLATDWFDYLFASIDELEQLTAPTGWTLREKKSDGAAYGVVLVLSGP